MEDGKQLLLLRSYVIFKGCQQTRAHTHTPRNTNKSKYNLSISIDQCSYFQTTFTGVWGNCYCGVNGMGCKPMDIVTIYVDDSNNIDFNLLGISW